MKIVHVAPGHVELGSAGVELRTLLGSCVAISLWQPLRKIGALSHVALPARNLPPGGRGLDGRFADEAWVKMSMLLAAHGISPNECVCKIFGGGRIFANEFANVGSRNIESVRQLLHSCGVAISKEHVGGIGHREVRFNLATGDVWMRHRPTQLTHGTDFKETIE
ncbi:MAG: chemotaxis protein CheD [Rhodocyclaceae bacterium]